MLPKECTYYIFLVKTNKYVYLLLFYNISFRVLFCQRKDTQTFLPECHQILFLYSHFKSVLKYEPKIIFRFRNYFLHKATPNPGIELAG